MISVPRCFPPVNGFQILKCCSTSNLNCQTSQLSGSCHKLLRQMRAAVVLLLIAACLAQNPPFKCNYAVQDVNGKFSDQIKIIPYGQAQTFQISCTGNLTQGHRVYTVSSILVPSDRDIKQMSSNESPDNFERTDLGFFITEYRPSINVTVTARSPDAFFLYVGENQESRADFDLGFLNRPITPSKLNITGDGLTLTAVGPLAKSPVTINIRYTTFNFGPRYITKTLFYPNGLQKGATISTPNNSGATYFPISYTWSVENNQFPGTTQFVGGAALKVRQW
ncbi:hypothetical protein PROFUN_03332 [Planoprotostelium fungivorum]|uniref:Uncharacterized protein n=1 Tax=Planoprotostelium fungivorum TaxID=1890364 RepID=A0A2P6NX02_9EUKA|nr:hypothetical protein PROFUN_03332 [Planoprotostelium fungivorum]